LRLFCALLLILASTLVFSAKRESITTPGPRVSPYAPIRIVLDGERRPGECVPEGKRLQAELETLHYPAGWTLAIMCTAVRWDSILREADVRNTHVAFTRISERITVFNSNIFHDFPQNYRHIVAHELGHINCNCADEGKAEELAHEMEKAPQSASK